MVWVWGMYGGVGECGLFGEGVVGELFEDGRW